MARTLRRYVQQDSRSSLIARAATEALTFLDATDPHHPTRDIGENPDAPGATAGLKMFWTVPGKVRDFVAQANAAQPAVVLVSGDVVEVDGDFAYFFENWDGLTVPYELMPGNHDYSLPYTTTRMQAVADGMGFGTAPLVAGSRMNRSVAYSANGVDVRFILVDVNVQRDNTIPEPNGSLTPAQKTWIAAELAASPEDIIFIGTHHGPHQHYQGWFVQQDAFDLRDIVEAEIAARPQRVITGLFGHDHSFRFGPARFDNLGGFHGIVTPVMLENTQAPFTKFHVFADGTLVWEIGRVTYAA